MTKWLQERGDHDHVSSKTSLNTTDEEQIINWGLIVNMIRIAMVLSNHSPKS
jgi:hypothetical protein